jgi:O-antigen/teichoic acid export membrane protein
LETLPLRESIDVRSQALSALDQGILSVGSLGFNILLARWLDPRSYGIFTLAYASIIFLGGIYNSLIMEPMSILGPRRHGGVSVNYFSSLILIHLLLTGVLIVFVVSVLSLKVWFGVGAEIVGLYEVVFATIVVTPALLLFWLIRRKFYVQLSPERGLQATLLYVGALAATTSGALLFDHLTLHGSFWIMAVASIAACLAGVGTIPSWADVREYGRLALRGYEEVLVDHWRYGKWAILASLVYWGTGNLYYYLAGIFVGLTEVAVLRVVVLFFQPVRTLQAGLTNMLLPLISTALGRDGCGDFFRRRVISISLSFGGIAALYGLLVVLIGKPLIRFVYGGRYDEVTSYLPVIAAVAVIESFAEGPSLGLKALEEPKLVFLAYGAGSLFTLMFGAAAVAVWGAFGAALGLLGSSAAFGCVAWFLYHSKVKRIAVTVLTRRE